MEKGHCFNPSQANPKEIGYEDDDDLDKVPSTDYDSDDL